MLILVAGIALAALAISWLYTITKSSAMMAAQETAEKIIKQIETGTQLMKVVTPAQVLLYSQDVAKAKIDLYLIFGTYPLQIKWSYGNGKVVHISGIVSSTSPKLGENCDCNKYGKEILMCKCGGTRYYVLMNDTVNVIVRYRLVKIALVHHGHWTLYLYYNAVSIVINMWNFTTIPRTASVRTGSVIKCSSYVTCNAIMRNLLCLYIPMELDVTITPLIPYGKTRVVSAHVECEVPGILNVYLCRHVTVCQVS